MMKGEIICYGLALVGVILTLIGRMDSEVRKYGAADH